MCVSHEAITNLKNLKITHCDNEISQLICQSHLREAAFPDHRTTNLSYTLINDADVQQKSHMNVKENPYPYNDCFLVRKMFFYPNFYWCTFTILLLVTRYQALSALNCYQATVEPGSLFCFIAFVTGPRDELILYGPNIIAFKTIYYLELTRKFGSKTQH